MPSSYAIGPHFEQFIQRQIASGRYRNASEVIRAALRLLEAREAWREAQLQVLREEIQKGIASGPDSPAEEVFARLEAKYIGNSADI